jgi:F0F1-type ATP synthase assembly protein I
MSVNPSDPKDAKDMSAYAFAFSLGWELVGSLAVCGIPGYLLDRKLGTSPWLTLVGAIAGICLGLFQLIRAGQRRQADGAKRR